jgi:hypothetical protein
MNSLAQLKKEVESTVKSATPTLNNQKKKLSLLKRLERWLEE